MAPTTNAATTTAAATTTTVAKKPPAGKKRGPKKKGRHRLWNVPKRRNRGQQALARKLGIPIPKPIRGVLLDLSGTLHVGPDTPIDGAVQAVERLHSAGIPVRLLTNTTKVSSNDLLRQLRAMGFLSSVKDDDDNSQSCLCTSTIAANKYLRQHNLRPLCLMEDTSDLDPSLLSPPHNCVLVGLAPTHFHYDRLNEAFQVLQRHPRLVAIHRANHYQREKDDELLSLGPGGFVSCLEAASGCPPAVVIGKPSAAFFESALWDGMDPASVCMVGDDVVQDVEGARGAGIGTTVLVQTGKYRTGDETTIGFPPTKTVPSIVQAVDHIINKMASPEAIKQKPT